MNFIVVGLPKTGKTMICDCLDSLDGFTVYDEIFGARMGNGNMPDHPLPFMNEIRKRNRRNCLVKWYQKEYKTNITDIRSTIKEKDIDNYLDYIFSKNDHVGFKLHHHHIQVLPYILEYIEKRSIKIIHTDRRNKVKQAIAILANRNRITHTKRKVSLKTHGVKKCIADIEWRTKELKEWFNDYLEMVYEDVTNDQHITELNISEIKKFLDINDIPDIVKVRTIKNTFSKIEDNIINHKEINELSTN
jgi:hypothetical protein